MKYLILTLTLLIGSYKAQAYQYSYCNQEKGIKLSFKHSRSLQKNYVAELEAFDVDGNKVSSNYTYFIFEELKTPPKSKLSTTPLKIPKFGIKPPHVMPKKAKGGYSSKKIKTYVFNLILDDEGNSLAESELPQGFTVIFETPNGHGRKATKVFLKYTNMIFDEKLQMFVPYTITIPITDKASAWHMKGKCKLPSTQKN